MIHLTPFTEADWYAFAGAQKPDDGEPMTGGIQIAGDGWTIADLDEQMATVVVDREKLQVLASESVWELRCGYHVGLLIAAQMQDPLHIEQLLRWKFQQIA